MLEEPVPAGKRSRAKSGVSNFTKHQILLDLFYYHYLSLPQIIKLRFSQGSKTTARDYMHQLHQDHLVQVLPLYQHSFQGANPGRPTSVFTAARAGLTYLAQVGLSDGRRYHPVEEMAKSQFFLKHTLLVNDTLISAVWLTRTNPQFAISRMIHERQMEEYRLRVKTKDQKQRQSAKLDLYLEWDIDLDGDTAKYHLGIEIDRGTENKRQFSEKIQVIIKSTEDNFLKLFGVGCPWLAILTTHSQKRADDIVEWIKEELAILKAQDLSPMFFVRFADPSKISPEELFLSPLWKKLSYQEGRWQTSWSPVLPS
jgi:hypothetical protein